MKTYEATYTDQTGKIVCKTIFDAQNLKEANKIAQLHKRNTPEIQKAGRVSTFVGSRENDLKNIKRLLKELDNAQKEYEEYKKQAQID
jgi:hypothetical protein